MTDSLELTYVKIIESYQKRIKNLELGAWNIYLLEGFSAKWESEVGKIVQLKIQMEQWEELYTDEISINLE